jgi:hypothetical protein
MVVADKFTATVKKLTVAQCTSAQTSSIDRTDADN